MESSICFKSKNGNNYMYDSKSLYLINIHPLITEIRKKELLNKYSFEEIGAVLLNEHPTISLSDILYYMNKYIYYKSCGFFSKIKSNKLLSGKITAKIVENQLANIDNVVFQVTEECNLNCQYCCYGELYTDHELKRNKSMDFETSKYILNYLISYWNSNLNESHNNIIGIGFYGGEPLVNFKLISQIVEFLNHAKIKNRPKFVFNMTTNALLLDKYSKFLVDNNFSLLISLDGDKNHNILRVDKNNKESFDRVFANVKKIQKDFPDYFRNNVQFNSVLNSNSSVKGIHEFIYKEFNKIPMIEPISDIELNRARIDKYNSIHKYYSETPDMISTRGDKSAIYKGIGSFFYYNLNNSYKHYFELITKRPVIRKRIPTGTCLPFWKKMYITSNGKIFACERIGLKHVLGNVDENINLDFNEIANKYNHYFNIINSQCVKCYHADTCTQCIFQLNFKDDKPFCLNVASEEQYKLYLCGIVSFIEDNSIYFNDINNIVFA